MEELRWIFSGVGVLAISGLYWWWKTRVQSKAKFKTSLAELYDEKSVAMDSTLGGPRSVSPSPQRKSEVGVLFVDDDTKFKVVSILRGHGWVNTRIIKDVSSLEMAEVISADIFFVDIQGVGKALQFRDEGLGLVVALKKKYPMKKVVIYSAEAGVNAFHLAFKMADDRISKDADPYEFIEVVERLSM